jgi:hypothetical protein
LIERDAYIIIIHVPRYTVFGFNGVLRYQIIQLENLVLALNKLVYYITHGCICFSYLINFSNYSKVLRRLISPRWCI